MRSLHTLLLILLLAVASAQPAHAGKPTPRATPIEAYEVARIDPQAGTFTVKANGQVRAFRARLGAEVTINGLKATFAEIEPGMMVKITTAEPGVASRLVATGLRARLPSPVSPSATPPAAAPPAATPPALGAASQASRKFQATILANSPDGFPLGDIRKGTRISLQYVEGKWKAEGRIAQFDPDSETDPKLTDRDKLAIALPTGTGTGRVLALVSPGTKKRPYVFEAPEDFPGLVLRINGGPSKNPGRVTYDVVVLPPAH
ncbi:MAG TPA: hypothetical protein VGM54_20860 [Chthoniobacter sp.]|jgi:hypothetical protein